MNAILKRLHQLSDDDLLSISEAVDIELGCRLDRTDGIPDSARRRAVSRGQSYRHGTGASAPPIRAVGLRNIPRRHAA
jgi:hypothetical protein